MLVLDLGRSGLLKINFELDGLNDFWMFGLD
jgi:hypothetical protein